MKKYANLVPLVMIIVVLGSWYMMISSVSSTKGEYNEYLELARENAKSGVTKLVIENYNKAIEINSTPEVYAEVADYYLSQGEIRKYVSWCEVFLEMYPTNALAYEYAVDAYATNGDYTEVFNVIETAHNRGIKSDKLASKEAELAYVYVVDFDRYDEASSFSSFFSAVSSEGKWGFVNRFGNLRVSCTYESVGVYTNSGYAPVKTTDGHAFFVDDTGAKILAQEEEKYISFGPVSDDRIAAEVSEGKFAYVDMKLNELYSGFDFAGTYNCEIAAVVKNGSWYVIDKNGNDVFGSFADIKLDEKKIAARNDRLFVATGANQYKLVDLTGNAVGSDTYEDAFVFNSVDSYTAVKKNGVWFFVDKNGNRLSDKTYEGARAYANGLAAVCINGKWGYVDESENLVIPNGFDGAKDFNEKGSAFINDGSGWRLLKIYRLNR